MFGLETMHQKECTTFRPPNTLNVIKIQQTLIIEQSIRLLQSIGKNKTCSSKNNTWLKVTRIARIE